MLTRIDMFGYGTVQEAIENAWLSTKYEIVWVLKAMSGTHPCYGLFIPDANGRTPAPETDYSLGLISRLGNFPAVVRYIHFERGICVPGV